MCKMKLLFVAMFVLLSTMLPAQRAKITFSFAMSQSGSQLSPDSIFVENLSSACDTMIYSPANSLRVTILAGIDEAIAEHQFGIESWHYDSSDRAITVMAFVPADKAKVYFIKLVETMIGRM